MLEFDAGVFGRELPVGFGVMGIAASLPCGGLVDEDLLVGDAAVETLRGEKISDVPKATEIARRANDLLAEHVSKRADRFRLRGVTAARPGCCCPRSTPMCR
jgi:hypothetical protein